MVMIQRCYACLKSRVLVSAVSHGRVASKRLCCWFVFCFFFLKKKNLCLDFKCSFFSTQLQARISEGQQPWKFTNELTHRFVTRDSGLRIADLARVLSVFVVLFKTIHIQDS